MKNTKISRILIPVDFSAASKNAIEYGAYLANAYRADIFLLHITQGANSYPDEWFAGQKKLAGKELIKEKVTEKLNNYAEEITKKYGVYVQHIITTGNLVLKMAEAVAEHSLDLIVMATKGVKGIKELFTGSIANKIVNLVPCPVITIQEGFQFSGIKSIVLPIDQSMHSRQKVSYVLPLATRCNALIYVLGVVTSSDKEDMAKFNVKLASVEEALKSVPLKYICKVVKGSNIATEALKYAEEVKADMLSIMTDHESNMKGGAFTRQIVNHSKTPVLSIKPITGPYESSN